MFETILGSSLGCAILVALVILLKPLLKKVCGYQAFYLFWILLMLAVLIPYSFNISGVTLDFQFPLDRYGLELNLDELSYTITDTASDIAVTDPLAGLNFFNYEETDAFIVQLPFSAVLLSFWILGMVIFYVYQILRSLSFRKKCRALPYLPAAGEMLDLLHAAKRQYKVKQNVELRIVKDIPCPITRGFLHPVIYMPHDIIYPEALFLLISHELVLIKRKTVLFKGLSYLASGIHWFNPLVHIARRQMAIDSKLAADAKILTKETKRMRETYVAALDGINSDHEIGDYFYINKHAAENRRRHILDESKRRFGFLFLILGIPLILISVMVFQINFSAETFGRWQTADNIQIAADDPAAAAKTYILTENEDAAATLEQMAYTGYSEDQTVATCLFALSEDVNWLVELGTVDGVWTPERYQILNDEAAQKEAASLAYDHMMAGFSYPGSALASVDTWAKAFSNQNGAVQFNLMTADNQKMVADYFRSMQWAPDHGEGKITSYEIKEGSLARITGYEVVFHRDDGNGNAVADLGYFIGLNEVDGEWRISEIDSICNSIDGEQVLVPTYPLLAAMVDVANLSQLTPPEIGVSQRETDENGSMTYLLVSHIEIYSDSPPVYVLSEMKDNLTKTWSYQIYPAYYRILSVPE